MNKNIIISDTIENITKDKLKPHPQNPRLHPNEQLELLSKSIDKFNFTNPVLIDEDNTILAGHGRVECIDDVNFAVPCRRITGMTEGEKTAYVLIDNRTADIAEYDQDLLAKLEQECSEYAALLENELENATANYTEDQLDDVPDDNEVEPTVRLGEVWQLGRHRIMCGDSTNKDNVDTLMNGAKCDMVFTDPPYGISYADKNEFLNTYDKGCSNQTPIKNDHLSVGEVSELWAKVFSVWGDYHREYSCYYIAFAQTGDLMLTMLLAMNNNKHPLKHCLIWNKNNHILGRCDYMYKHEPILYGWQHKHKFYKNGDQNKSVLDFAKPLKNDLHPTMKPVALIENFILNSTLKDMLVCDYFLGSGSTLIACENTNRICYGMELDPHYCDVIIKRWETLTGGKAVKVDV